MANHNNGMLGLAHFGFTLNDYTKHLLHTLRREAGYISVLAGEQHIAKDPAQIGYDRILKDVRPNEQRAADFLRQSPPQPFFLDIGFNATHRTYPEPGPLDNPNYVRPPAPIPDTPETRRDMAGFITLARKLDTQMGVVLDALEESGLSENTLVICTTDHGLAFPAMKCNLTDHGTGVMLILRGPGGFEGGQVSDALVSQIDLFPTLCDLLGIKQPDWLQGRSILPLVQGKVDAIREAVFGEINFHVSLEPERTIRTIRWRYIRRFDGRTSPVLPNTDDSPSKTLWIESGWRNHAPAAEQLYDVIFDPNQANNLAGNPSYREIQAELSARLEEWMAETDDPLLRGPLEWPEGFPRLAPDRTSASEINL
jgi:arylsulfatase A-like enzyme